jgi:phosphoribosylformimino-5-aminoimidazole carboxamide ribotide isomerase
MLVIPAIDIKDGQCVRLRQGRMDDVTVFGTDPVAMARHWFAEGCKRLHLVDLDGAVSGTPRIAGIIRAISAEARGVPVQVGGGIREIATIRGYVDAGIDQVIIGTRAVREPAFLAEACAAFPNRILLGLDARDGMIATDGWESTTNESAVTFAKRVAHLPLAGIVYTDIARDGMGSGLNVAATIDLAEQSGIAVIASGGVRDLDHLRELARAAAASRGTVLGVISGRALYEGTLDLRSAQALLQPSAAG